MISVSKRKEGRRALPACLLSLFFALIAVFGLSSAEAATDASEITREQFVKAVANVAATARKNGYIYGDSRRAVPTSDKKISCDRLIAKALWDLGFQDQETGGITCGTMRPYLRNHGFVESRSLSDIGYGSIVLIMHTTTTYYSHTFVTIGFNRSNMTLSRYDCGSNTRIQSVQPFVDDPWPSSWRTDNLYVYNIPDVPKIPVAESVALDLSEYTAGTGDTFSLQASISPENASSMAVEWSSSNPAIATVTADGAVKLLAPGTAEIKAQVKDTDKFAVCKVTSYEVPVTRVRLSETKLTIPVGYAEGLAAKVSPASATYPFVTWTSSNPSVASVTKSGMVTGLRPGKASITATAGKKSQTCTVTVKRYPVASIKLNKKKLSIKAGKTKQLKVKITPSYATNRQVTWKSSNNKVARVDKNGVVKALRRGTAVIKAVAKDGKKKAVCTVTVM